MECYQYYLDNKMHNIEIIVFLYINQYNIIQKIYFEYILTKTQLQGSQHRDHKAILGSQENAHLSFIKNRHSCRIYYFTVSSVFSYFAPKFSVKISTLIRPNRVQMVVRTGFLVRMRFARVHVPYSNICIPRSNNTPQIVFSESFSHQAPMFHISCHRKEVWTTNNASEYIK